jgi:hypothetical protein
MAGGAGRRPTNMKNNDKHLEGLLQEWRVTSELPPRFSEHVWKRIESASIPGISLVDAARAWLTMAFARPAFAVAYVSVLITAGLALGFFQANYKAAEWDRQLEARYVRSIDPYQRGQ